MPLQALVDLLRTTAVDTAEAAVKQQPVDANSRAAAAVPDVVVKVETALFALLLPG